MSLQNSQPFRGGEYDADKRVARKKRKLNFLCAITPLAGPSYQRQEVLHSLSVQLIGNHFLVPGARPDRIPLRRFNDWTRPNLTENRLDGVTTTHSFAL